MADIEPGLVTIFGGSGFLGAQAVRAFAKRGWRIRVAVPHPNRVLDAKTQGHVGQIQPVLCDVRSPDDVAAALKGAAAAVNLVGVLYETPGRNFETMHVDAARNVAEACARAGVQRLVHVSAIGADANAASDYARTKGRGEEAVRNAFPGATIVRPSILFGQGDGFLNRFAQLAGMAPALPLIGGGETRFQPAFVGDVAEALVRAVDAPNRTFELGGPEVMTFKQVLELILTEIRKTRLLLPLPFFAARPIGALAQLTAIVGIPPVLTRDQVVSLQSDNVVAEGAEGFAELGIDPVGVEAIAPSYLWRYRKGGQFSERAEPAPDFIPA